MHPRTSEYKKNGFLLFTDFIPTATIQEIRQEATYIFGTQLIKHGLISSLNVSETEFEQAMYSLFKSNVDVISNCGKQIQHLISLHKLSLSDKIIDTVKFLGLEFPNISTRPVLYFNTPHLAQKEVYNKLTAHQDWRSMQGSLDSIIVWIPLTDINTELGALEIVPGTHTLGLLKSDLIDGYGKLEQDKFENMKFQPVEVKQGDALFFSSFLVHRSGNNTTDHIRWSCHFRYNNLKENTFIERGYPHPYIYRPMEELITPDFPQVEQVQNLFKK